jgi:hypothetical protein
VAVQGSLHEYQASIDKKIAEQQSYYAKRRQQIAAVRHEDNDDRFALSRRIRALDYASRLTADPGGLMQIDSLLDHLRQSAAADFTDYKDQRALEAAAEKEYDEALETIERQSAAIAATRNALGALASKASRKERIEAAAAFADELKTRLAEQNATKQ